MQGTVENAKKYARRMERLLKDIPEGWGLFCMDGQMFLVAPGLFEDILSGAVSDLTYAPDQTLMIPSGCINGDSGGW